MRSQTISKAKRLRIAEAAHYRCAYCLTTQRVIGPLLEIDHIMPEACGGSSDEGNLTLACPLCNGHKADKIDAIDPQTQQLVALFHPLMDNWSDHFEWTEEFTVILGKTPIGRATVDALAMNQPDMVITRRLWVIAGWHPPESTSG